MKQMLNKTKEPTSTKYCTDYYYLVLDYRKDVFGIHEKCPPFGF